MPTPREVIISIEVAGDVMPVDELTKEVSMERRMQEAENYDMGVGSLQLRGGRRSLLE